MCGRVGLAFEWKTVWDHLSLAGDPPTGGESRYNVAPSTRTRDRVSWQTLPALRRADHGCRADDLVWPLIPHWLDDELPKYATANCRTEPGQPFSETVARKPAFRTAWQRDQRCAVLISWFYEWDPRTRPRQPWRVHPVDAPVLCLAGLWDRNAAGDRPPRDSLTILTTEPNAMLRSIGHHRAPVLLDRDGLDAWLNGSRSDAENRLRPPPDDVLAAHRVTRRVNNPGYAEADLLETADDD